MEASLDSRPEIRTRNVDFGRGGPLPRHWHGGDPYVTHFFNGLSIMFPEGERFFVDSVRHFQDAITDPKLKEDVRGFCGQEGIHGREHRRFNERVAELGYPVERVEAFVRAGIAIDRKLPPKWQLALTCALEHFTAVFADVVLRDPRAFRDADPDVARLWLWHAVEETEHKAVAFDVYRTVAPGLGGYLRRVVVMLWATIGFAAQIFLHESWLVRHDGMFWKLAARRRALRYFWKEPGLLRQGLRHYLSYYRPDFHPWQLDNTALVTRWKAEYAAG